MRNDDELFTSAATAAAATAAPLQCCTRSPASLLVRASARSCARSFICALVRCVARSLARSFISFVRAFISFVHVYACLGSLARLALHFALYYYDFFLVRALRIAFGCLACTRHDSAMCVSVCVRVCMCVCVHFPRLLHVFAFLSNVYCLTPVA